MAEKGNGTINANFSMRWRLAGKFFAEPAVSKFQVREAFGISSSLGLSRLGVIRAAMEKILNGMSSQLL